MFTVFIASAASELGARVLFPQSVLPIFEIDKTRGVRLIGGAHSRLRSASGNITTVRIGKDGYRQEQQWQGKALALVGDSQVLGYHVESSDTASSQLHDVSGGQIWAKNAGVPTYGPKEYVDTIESLASGSIQDFWVIINERNDYAEANAPNIKRTTANYGLPVRKGAKVSAPKLWLRAHSALYASISTRTWVWPTSAENEGVETPKVLFPNGFSYTAQQPDSAVKRTIHRLENEIRRADAVCERYDCTVHVAVLPADFTVKSTPHSKYKRPDGLDDIRRYRRELKKHRFVLDLEPHLETSDQAFLHDDGHLSREGHRIVADAIWQSMSSKLETEKIGAQK